MKRVAVALFLSLFSVVVLAQPTSSAPPDLDSYVGKVMSAFEVPGVSLAIVKDGQTIVARGFGVRKLGETAPVDAKTQFGTQYDTFVVRWRDRELRADAFVTFALTPDGAIDQAKMAAVSSATDFSFDFQDLLLKPVK
jgi:hypothetical protein